MPFDGFIAVFHCGVHEFFILSADTLDELVASGKIRLQFCDLVLRFCKKIFAIVQFRLYGREHFLFFAIFLFVLCKLFNGSGIFRDQPVALERLVNGKNIFFRIRREMNKQ